MALAYPIYTLLRDGKIWQALLLTAIAASFIVNMAFVIVSRTALVTHAGHARGVRAAASEMADQRDPLRRAATVVLGALAWATSPQLQATAETFARDYRLYKEYNQSDLDRAAAGVLEKSLRFFAEAPLIGHGTGSTRGLFEAAATARRCLRRSR